MNKYAKALKQVSAKRAKTDADFIEMQRIEWYASLYTEGGQLVIPDDVLEAVLVGGARKAKLGKQAEAGMFADGHTRIQFSGDDLTVDELFERDENRLTCGVRVQRNKVMRTRCRIKEWSIVPKIFYEDSLLNAQQVKDAIAAAGSQVGLCDWRPKYGRFDVEFL